MYKKMKRLLAMLAIIIIALLYAAVLVLSFMDSAQSRELLMIALVATIVLPVLLYIYLWLYRVFKGNDEE